MADEFDLRTLTWGLLGRSGEIERSKIVAELLREIEPGDRESALEQALPAYVALQETKYRRDTEICASAASAAEDVKVGKLHPLPQRSAKRERIAGWWRRALEEKYTTATPGVLKSLGDMDRNDLLFAIQTREEAAARTRARALALRGLLDLMERHEVSRVRELPESVLSAVLVKAA